MSFLGRLVAKRHYIWRFALYWIAFLLLSVVHWFIDYFGSLTIPQLHFYSHFSGGLILDTDSALLVAISLKCLLIPTLIASLVVAFELYVNTMEDKGAVTGPPFDPAPGYKRFFAAIARGLPCYVSVASVLIVLTQLSFFSYVASRFGPDEFSKHYAEPATVTLQAKSLKNLVLIYVESLESTYSDSGIFGEDLLADVNALTGSSFDAYLPVPGTGWTIAAIVATQCGVPLQFVPGTPSDENGEHIDSFLPRATCLGDILHRFGYYNVFLGGANLRFSGKGRFLAQHHYDEALGFSEWLKDKAMAQRFNGWGIYDDVLLDAAKKKLLQLQASGKLFNLTILTLDTHHPKGFYSELCNERGAVKFEDIVKCTSSQLADFIDFARRHDLMTNTNFIIIGDHVAMPNPVYQQLLRDRQRKIFNKFISANLPAKSREDIVPFDLLPTILEFQGIDVRGNRLGLGCSAFFEDAQPCKKLSIDDEFLGTLPNSKTYQRLWAE